MNLREKWRSRQRHSLLENTVMLYILQFSNMALGMLTQGYKMRVLGVCRQLFSDFFGLRLSALGHGQDFGKARG